MQVNPAAHEPREFVLEVDHGEARHVPGIELDENVDVTLWAEVVAENRAKEGESPDVVTTTKVGKALAIDRNLR